MNNTLINSKSADFKQSKRNAVESLRAIVFKIGNLNLALRIETIYKILNQTAVYGSSLNGLALAQVGDRDVTVVDLQEQLSAANLFSEASQVRYLIVVQNSLGEYYGIPVASVPVLIDIPLSTIRVLPASYRQTSLLRSASHVCHVSHTAEQLTIFLLDVEQVLPSV